MGDADNEKVKPHIEDTAPKKPGQANPQKPDHTQRIPNPGQQPQQPPPQR